MAAPVLVKPIPSQVVNERAAYGPLDLKTFIHVPKDSEPATFHAELKSGESLPDGMICTSDGILTGIPGRETQGIYEIVITAENGEGSVQTELAFTIKPSVLTSGTEYVEQLKSQVWEALGKDMPLPNFEELYNRPITIQEVYHLFERWGTLTIWDSFNLDSPGPLNKLQLEGASKHYHVYDRGSCLVASPVDLFSNERTLEDGLQTARAVAREVYNRGWTIQLAGFDKFIRAAWVEVQLLGDKFGKPLNVINFSPSHDEVRIYTEQTAYRGIE